MLKRFALFCIIVPLPFLIPMLWDLVYVLPLDYKNYPKCVVDTNISNGASCFIWGIPRRKFDFDNPAKMRQVLSGNADYSKNEYKVPDKVFTFDCDTLGYIKEYSEDSIFVRIMGKYKLTKNVYSFDGYVLRSQIRLIKE